MRFGNEIAFPSPDTPRHVDLHWKLLYECYDLEVDHQALRDRSVEVAVEGRPVRTLAPADFLNYLAMRVAIDCWSSIHRLIDLALP